MKKGISSKASPFKSDVIGSYKQVYAKYGGTGQVMPQYTFVFSMYHPPCIFQEP